MSKITYRSLSGYKYGLMERYAHETGMTLDAAVASRNGWVKMNRSERLTTKKGYAWDGPSGPTIDSKNFMRGSLVHDALYQLMREAPATAQAQTSCYATSAAGRHVEGTRRLRLPRRARLRRERRQTAEEAEAGAHHGAVGVSSGRARPHFSSTIVLVCDVSTLEVRPSAAL